MDREICPGNTGNVMRIHSGLDGSAFFFLSISAHFYFPVRNRNFKNVIIRYNKKVWLRLSDRFSHKSTGLIVSTGEGGVSSKAATPPLSCTDWRSRSPGPSRI